MVVFSVIPLTQDCATGTIGDDSDMLKHDTDATTRVRACTIESPAASMSSHHDNHTRTPRPFQNTPRRSYPGSQNGQQTEARSKAWRAALTVIEAAALSEQWRMGPEQTPAETVLQFSLKTKDRRIFTLFASAEALDPDTFIEALDSEDLHERVTFTGEFIQRMSRHLSG